MSGVSGKMRFGHPDPGFSLSFWVYEVIEADKKTLQLQKPRFLLFLDLLTRLSP